MVFGSAGGGSFGMRGGGTFGSEGGSESMMGSECCVIVNHLNGDLVIKRLTLNEVDALNLFTDNNGATVNQHNSQSGDPYDRARFYKIKGEINTVGEKMCLKLNQGLSDRTVTPEPTAAGKNSPFVLEGAGQRCVLKCDGGSFPGGGDSGTEPTNENTVKPLVHVSTHGSDPVTGDPESVIHMWNVTWKTCNKNSCRSPNKDGNDETHHDPRPGDDGYIDPTTGEGNPHGLGPWPGGDGVDDGCPRTQYGTGPQEGDGGGSPKGPPGEKFEPVWICIREYHSHGNWSYCYEVDSATAASRWPDDVKFSSKEDCQRNCRTGPTWGGDPGGGPAGPIPGGGDPSDGNPSPPSMPPSPPKEPPPGASPPLCCCEKYSYLEVDTMIRFDIPRVDSAAERVLIGEFGGGAATHSDMCDRLFYKALNRELKFKIPEKINCRCGRNKDKRSLELPEDTPPPPMGHIVGMDQEANPTTDFAIPECLFYK